jgi:hypothetical protein
VRSRLILAGVAALVASCHRGPPPPVLVVEVSACAEWRVGPRCDVASEPIVLWVAETEPAAIRLELDGAALPPLEEARIQGGARLKVSVRPGVLTAQVEGRAPWTLLIGAHTRDAGLDEVAKLRRSGQLEVAEQKLAALGPGPGRAAQRARNALAADRVDEAIAAFEASIAEAEQQGRLRSAVEDAGVLSYALINHRYEPARIARQLEVLDRLAVGYADGRSYALYYRLMLASEQRDVRSGVKYGRALVALSERLGDESAAVDARQAMTNLLVVAGRWSDASRELEALRLVVGDQGAPCKAAELWSNIGWYRLLGHRQAPDVFPELPLGELDLALELYRTACPRPLLRANAELNRSWAALFAGDLPAARRHWRSAREHSRDSDARTQMHLMHLEAELALGEGRPREALAAFAVLAADAARRGAADAAWQAELGRGRALEAAGELRSALAAYREAERRLLALAERVPLGEGRDGLLFDRRIGAERGVAVALAAGDLASAVAIIRQSRQGTLAWARRLGEDVDQVQLKRVADARRALDGAVSSAWTRSATTALAPPPAEVVAKLEALDALFAVPGQRERRPLVLEPDEAAVFAQPVGAGMVVVVQRGATLRGETLATAALPALDTTAPLLRGARRVRIYAHPAVERLDWMALTLDGQPLYRVATTTFHADLGAPATALPPVRRALVLADPVRALPRARVDAAQAGQRLSAAGWSVRRVESVDRRSLLRLLAQPTELLHYSGHGVQAAADGLESGIPVAEGQRLTVVDVLTSTSVPRRVVLAACDLGQRGSTLGAPGLGLAPALLLAGADMVVAAVRPVDDAATAVWVERFYSYAAATDDWAEALRQTTAELAEHQDATALRLWLAD